MEEFSFIPEKKIHPREAVKRQSTSTFPCIPPMPERLATEKKKGGGRGNELPWRISGKEPACQSKRHEAWSLGWEDALEKEKATHSNILAWRIPWTEEPGGLHSMKLQSWTGPSN